VDPAQSDELGEDGPVARKERLVVIGTVVVCRGANAQGAAVCGVQTTDRGH